MLTVCRPIRVQQLLAGENQTYDGQVSLETPRDASACIYCVYSAGFGRW